MTLLDERIQNFVASLSPDEKVRLTAAENETMAKDTQALLNASKKKAQMVPSQVPQDEEQLEAANSQMNPPPAPMEPPGVQGQMDPNMPMEPPVQAATSANSANSQMQPPPPAPVQPPPVQAATSATSQEVVPPADPMLDQDVQAQDISNYIDDHDQSEAPQMTDDEMGLKEARYAEVYGHLTARVTASRDIEIYDPLSGSKTAMLTIRPNATTKKSARSMKDCAIAILRTIANEGLTKTASKWKASVKVADGGVVDYGDMNIADKPSHDKDSIEEDGESVLKNEEYNGNGVTSVTPEDGLAAAEKHPKRNVPGLGGPLKTAQISGGSLADRETNMAEQNDRSEKDLSVVDGAETNMREERQPFKMSDSSLDDAVNVLADPNYKNKSAASAIESEEPEPAPVMEEEPAEEEKIAAFYAKKAELQVAQKMREFAAKFGRCVRMAARRQALNLEENQIKIAMADALMTPAFINRHEEFAPMDERTATFVIERALNQTTAIQHIDSLLNRAASLMSMNDQALAQIEADLQRTNAILPRTAQEEFGVDEEEVEPPVEVDVEEKAASLRRKASSGNFDINPQFGRKAERMTEKREQIRASLGATKGASDARTFLPQGRG